MAKIPNVILTGSTGWFGQSFIYTFVKKFGLDNINNLYLISSDGRNFRHKILNEDFQTSTLETVKIDNKIDLFVQSAFLTRDKLTKFGQKKYIEVNQEIIEKTDVLVDKCSPTKRIVISSGAVLDKNDIYGSMKLKEEESVRISSSDLSIIFRVYAALGINTPFNSWSAVSDLISSANRSNNIDIKSKNNVVRGFVSFEKLSQLILEISAKKERKKFQIIDAIEHVNSLKEVASVISMIKGTDINGKIDFNEISNIYTSDPRNFLNMLKKYNLNMSSLENDIHETLQSPHLN
tara:strand:- start:21000 stop:21875 length:876 start_codon:yes stop_codon:yes gene_type:complete